MNWLTFKRSVLPYGLFKRALTAICFLGAGLTVTAQEAIEEEPVMPVFTIAATDTVLDTDDITLPDSVIRELARQIGMVDTAAVNPHMHSIGYYWNEETQQYQRKELNRYERRRLRSWKRWSKLIPNQATLQYAGSIGMFNVGLGWHYGKHDNWETEILFGFLPKYQTGAAHATFTLKERYIPWHCSLGSRWELHPLTTGLFFNTISGDEFWKNEPDRYPAPYYRFSTKFRANVFLGQRIRYKIPKGKRFFNQAIAFYYEISSCDLYIISKAINKEYKWKDTLSLAFGLRWDM